nr:LysR substrate-binding domain-containing protein [Mannheimia granulomatis]
MVLNQQGIAWLPEYSIIDELQTRKVVILDQNDLVIPIKGYIYRMDTRLNNAAERFWEHLKQIQSLMF